MPKYLWCLRQGINLRCCNKKEYTKKLMKDFFLFIYSVGPKGTRQGVNPQNLDRYFIFFLFFHHRCTILYCIWPEFSSTLLMNLDSGVPETFGRPVQTSGPDWRTCPLTVTLDGQTVKLLSACLEKSPGQWRFRVPDTAWWFCSTSTGII